MGVACPLLSSEQRRLFREQGYLLLTDFLPEKQFAVLDDEVRKYRGEVRECIQGDTQTHRTLLTTRRCVTCRPASADP